jgi:hypothetical protein
MACIFEIHNGGNSNSGNELSADKIDIDVVPIKGRFL